MLLCSAPLVTRFRASSAHPGVSGSRLAFGLVCSLSLVGCAGWRDHGDTYYGHRTAAGDATYSFGMPGDSWRPVRDVDDIQVAWVNPALGGVGLIEVHAQCDEQGDSSLSQYTDHLRIDWDDWSVVEQAETKLVGRAALRTVVDASLDGIARRSELWVVKKNGCLFDLRYSAGVEDFASGQRDFATVVQGFRFPR